MLYIVIGVDWDSCEEGIWSTTIFFLGNFYVVLFISSLLGLGQRVKPIMF
jgi:hypothetical protein